MIHQPHITPAPSTAGVRALTPTEQLHALLADLTPAECADLVGELLDPSAAGPFGRSDWADSDVFEAFAPVTRAYRINHSSIARTLETDDAPYVPEYCDPEAGKRSLFGGVA